MLLLTEKHHLDVRSLRAAWTPMFGEAFEFVAMNRETVYIYSFRVELVSQAD